MATSPPTSSPALRRARNVKGSLFIRSRSLGTRRAFHYACTTHYQREPEMCSESMLLPMEPLDRAILGILEQDVLQPSILVKAVEKAPQQLHTHDDEPDVRSAALRKDVAHVEAELARLATAIATGGSLSTLLSAVHDREERRMRLHAELAALDGVPFAQFDAVTMEHELRSYLVGWPSRANSTARRHGRSFGSSSPAAFGSGARSRARRSTTTSKERLRSVGFSVGWSGLKGLVSPTGFSRKWHSP